MSSMSGKVFFDFKDYIKFYKFKLNFAQYKSSAIADFRLSACNSDDFAQSADSI